MGPAQCAVWNPPLPPCLWRRGITLSARRQAMENESFNNHQRDYEATSHKNDLAL